MNVLEAACESIAARERGQRAARLAVFAAIADADLPPDAQSRLLAALVKRGLLPGGD